VEGGVDIEDFGVDEGPKPLPSIGKLYDAIKDMYPDLTYEGLVSDIKQIAKGAA